MNRFSVLRAFVLSLIICLPIVAMSGCGDPEVVPTPVELDPTLNPGDTTANNGKPNRSLDPTLK